MTNQVNEVLEKIRDICDLKKLEFGCLVMLNNQTEDGWRFEIIRRGKEDKWLAYELGKNSVSYLPEYNIKIIGLPVQLNHLLLAIKGYVAMGNTGEIVDSNDEKVIGLRYNLQKSVEDNLHSNPELTKWVHGVIIGKE